MSPPLLCTLYQVILRARKEFQGRPCIDNVRIMVEEGHQRIRTYFGKCMAFFADANANVFVGVRWYEPADAGENLIDPIVRLAKLQLSPGNLSRSYKEWRTAISTRRKGISEE